MKKALFILLLVVAGFWAMVSLAQVSQKGGQIPRMVRVAIVRDARELDLAIDGPYRFLDAQNLNLIGQGRKLVKARIRLLDKGIFMGMDVYGAKRILIKPDTDFSININNHSFRGDILLIRTPNNRLTVVNSINIEDYIKGVLYHEISHHWPIEAIKAQAVATRTYALYKMQSSSKNDYDVTNDIYSQVYGGKDSERYRTGLGVDRTMGQILTFQGKILPAYFHATCAGMTEDAKELWDTELAPLRGVPCMFCQDSPHMSWKKNYRLKDIQNNLTKKGLKIGLIENIQILERDRSGRIKNLEITDRDGHQLVISGKDFRELMGPNDLRSNNFEITMKGYYVDFNGKGWGHGVGLCQWGARGMAQQQFNYKQILSYYYPGSNLIDYHELAKSETVSSK